MGKLAKAFLVKFLGQEKTAKLRNELATFEQHDDESLYEAWRRFLRLQRQCPHHGIPEWMLIQTFYNGLTHEFRIYIDAASGGSEAKELIEKMAANDNYHPNGRNRAKKGGKYDVDALTTLTNTVQALSHKFDRFQAGSSMMHNHAFSYKNTQAQLNPPPPPRNKFNAPPGFQARAPFNPHVNQGVNQQPPPIQQKSNLEIMMENLLAQQTNFMAQQGKRNEKTNHTIQQIQAQNKLLESQISQLAHQVGQSSKATGHFPGNTKQPSKGHINAVILRNGKELQDHPLKEPSNRTVEEMVQPEKALENEIIEEEKKEPTPTPIRPYTPPVPFPQRLAHAKLEKKYGKFLDILKKLHINIPFLDAISEMPSYAKFLKDMLSNKRKIEENVIVSLTAECSAILQNKLPKKLGDPGSYSIPVKLGDIEIKKALCDLGESVSLMPLSICNKLQMGEPKPTRISL
ncbi:uncharacterized protein LOC125492650 [Beta vulgaris subsp. vulgaris]|uniref:uncharacterized protein LOC125492650 n=1 Tax=Beta vulgaris subsp. vulgaris TaxID=3555 RepID=UPI002036A7BC|nr:uncharacterized protein LOC125492650 [Beta vulgaris subsp. vulgaris]